MTAAGWSGSEFIPDPMPSRKLFDELTAAAADVTAAEKSGDVVAAAAARSEFARLKGLYRDEVRASHHGRLEAERGGWSS